jgi:hypothetical protein
MNCCVLVGGLFQLLIYSAMPVLVISLCSRIGLWYARAHKKDRIDTDYLDSMMTMFPYVRSLIYEYVVVMIVHAKPNTNLVMDKHPSESWGARKLYSCDGVQGALYCREPRDTRNF